MDSRSIFRPPHVRSRRRDEFRSSEGQRSVQALEAEAGVRGSKKNRRGPGPVRTKTDTGGRGEKPQALEQTVVKELGKLTPYVRNKGALLETEGAEKRLWELFIKNTALC